MRRTRQSTGARVVPMTCVLGTLGWRAFPPETHMVACLPWPLPMGASVSFSDLSRGGYFTRACRAEGSVPFCAWGPRTQQYGVALCAAWGLVVRAAYEHWDWRSTLAGKNVLTAIDAFVASSTQPAPCLVWIPASRGGLSLLLPPGC